MREQGDFKSGVKRFAYEGNRGNKGSTTGEDFDSFTAQKPAKKTKELEELQDIWSIQKNVSISGSSMPLKPQGNTVQAPPTGTGFYSRHSQHSSVKLSDGMRGPAGMNAQGPMKNSFSLGPQRSGYSYSQPEPQGGVTKLPQLAPLQGVAKSPAPGRYGDPQVQSPGSIKLSPRGDLQAQPPGNLRQSPRGEFPAQPPSNPRQSPRGELSAQPPANPRQSPRGPVSSPRTSLGLQRPSQHYAGPQQPSNNSRASGAGSQWPSL